MAANDTITDTNEMEVCVKYGQLFIRTANLVWFNAPSILKIKLQTMIFPKGLAYPFEGISNHNLILPFKLNRVFAEARSLNVSNSGDRWKQIFDSLNLTYHKLIKLGFTYHNGEVALLRVVRRIEMNNSSLFDEKTFYPAFLNDLKHCKREIIIESPFITTERMRTFDLVFSNLLEKGIKIYIITRDPREHHNGFDTQSEEAIRWCESLGIQVLLYVGNHHRKLAILDRRILWEDSLNILSQLHSREIMRRIDNNELTMEMFNFLRLSRYL